MDKHLAKNKEEHLRPELKAAVQLGDFVEQAIAKGIEVVGLEPPLLPEPEEGAAAVLAEKVWYKKELPEGMSGDGSGYHIYVKAGRISNLCIFLSGGGIAWNTYTAARPVTGGKVAAWLPNYYWNNLRTFTQIMNIDAGITRTEDPSNPFDDWNFLVVPYSTGDMHLGRQDFDYISEEGNPETLHFHGHANFRLAMDTCKTLFPEADKILIAGESAGAFAVPALAEEIADDYYPGCKDITLFSDSAQLLSPHWRHTVRDVWNAPEHAWKDIHGQNLTLEWYRALYERNPGRFRCLYAGSTRDYLLSAFYSDMKYKEYTTDYGLQKTFFKQMRTMLRHLQELDPDFGIFVYNFFNPIAAGGGTIHTAVRTPRFTMKAEEGTSMAQWLAECVSGHVRSVGLGLMKL